MIDKYYVKAKNSKQLEAAFKLAHSFNLNYHVKIVYDAKHKSSYKFFILAEESDFKEFERFYLNQIG